MHIHWNCWCVIRPEFRLHYAVHIPCGFVYCNYLTKVSSVACFFTEFSYSKFVWLVEVYVRHVLCIQFLWWALAAQHNTLPHSHGIQDMPATFCLRSSFHRPQHANLASCCIPLSLYLVSIMFIFPEGDCICGIMTKASCFTSLQLRFLSQGKCGLHCHVAEVLYFTV
jgi:hypothetical protein